MANIDHDELLAAATDVITEKYAIINRLKAQNAEMLAALKFYIEAEDTGLESDELDKFSELARAAYAKATAA